LPFPIAFPDENGAAVRVVRFVSGWNSALILQLSADLEFREAHAAFLPSRLNYLNTANDFGFHFHMASHFIEKGVRGFRI